VQVGAGGCRWVQVGVCLRVFDFGVCKSVWVSAGLEGAGVCSPLYECG
jgi:hypothetical protein